MRWTTLGAAGAAAISTAEQASSSDFIGAPLPNA
jgi:hypothetical protein